MLASGNRKCFMTICDLCYEENRINDGPETCIECGADMCPEHGEGEFCTRCAVLEREYAAAAPLQQALAGE